MFSVSRRGVSLWMLAGSLLVSSCGPHAPDTVGGSVSSSRGTLTAGTGIDAVDDKRLLNADREPGNWMSVGRTYDEQRYTPLAQINDANVGKLGIAWYYDLETNRGQEATPIVVD